MRSGEVGGDPGVEIGISEGNFILKIANGCNFALEEEGEGITPLRKEGALQITVRVKSGPTVYRFLLTSMSLR